MIAFNRDDLGCCKLLHSTWKNDEKLRYDVLQEVGLCEYYLQTQCVSGRQARHKGICKKTDRMNYLHVHTHA
jgi:hypothetical protein